MGRAGLAALACAAALLSLGCPESRAERGRDALRLVVRMHREYCLAETRLAGDFSRRPEAAQARGLPFWRRCRLADTDGLRIQRELLDSYLALREGARDEDLPGRVRQYLARREASALQEVQALDRAQREDPAPLDVLVRQGERQISQEHWAIARKYQALLKAQAR